MFYRLLPIFLFTVTLLAACTSESTNAEEVGSAEAQQVVTGGSPTEAMKANATQEGDAYGLAKRALGNLQSAYDASGNAVVNQGKVSVLLNEEFTLILKDEKDGNSSEQQVNLADLNPDLKSYEWIVDNDENPNPGVKIPVLEGKSAVKLRENGSSKGTADFLEIRLAERALVQQSVSGVIFAIRAARGEPLDK